MPINNALALGIQAPKIDFTSPLVAAAKMRALQGQDTLNALKVQALQDRRNALAQYQTTDDINALRGQPALMAQIIEARSKLDDEKRKKLDYTITANARSAQRVMAISDPTTRASAWKQELDKAREEGRIDEATYRSQLLAGPTDENLQAILNRALPVAKFIELEQKKKDRATTIAAINTLTPAFTGVRKPGAKTDLVSAESGGDPTLVNRFGYAGLHQFGAPRLADLDLYKPGDKENMAKWPTTSKTAPNKWSGEFSIPGHPEVKTLDDFRKSPAAQATAFQIHRARMQTEIKDAGLDKYVGKTINGVQITQAGLENMIHLGGANGAKKFLESNGVYNPKDANGTSLLDYARLGTRQAANEMPTSLSENDARLVAELPRLNKMRLMLGASNAPKSVTDALDKMIDHANKLVEPSAPMKMYDLAMKQRRKLGLPLIPIDQWNIEQKKAGATNVIQNVGGKALQEGLVKRYLKAEDTATEAASSIRMYETMDKLLDNPDVYTGTAGEQINTLKKFGATLFNLSFKGVPNEEVARKISDQLALQFKKEADDPRMSDADREFYRRMSVGLNDSAKGRKLLIAVRISELEYKQEQARVWREHLRPDNTVDAKVFEALAQLEAKRRSKIGEFMTEAEKVAGETPQPAPTAGTSGAFEELKKMYPGLK